jgi:fumarylpyruvate hydrolase
MGSDPEREPPFFFCKPADAIVPGGGRVDYPPMTNDLHHEIELVVALGRSATAVLADKALDAVFGYAVGIDLTRRDLQLTLRTAGRPWELGKAFDQSAPISPISPAAAIGHIAQGEIWLRVNGEERQRGDVSSMIWSVPLLIAALSEYFTLMPGDLIFTGTPAGVGQVSRGDKLIGGVQGLGELSVQISLGD